MKNKNKKIDKNIYWKLFLGSKTRYLMFWIHLPCFGTFISISSDLNNLDIATLWQEFIYFGLMTLFLILRGIPIVKMRKNNWNNDYLFSISFYLFQMFIIISPIFYIYEQNQHTLKLLILSICMVLIDLFIFIRLYIINKKLAIAILKWKNTYPIIKKHLIN